MTDAREWFTSASGRRITATEIAKHLKVSRNTVNTRMQEGLSSDDIITIARAVGVRPLDALIELGKLTYDEVYAFLEDGGKLLETASEGEIALELAQRLNTAKDLQNWLAGQHPELDEEADDDEDSVTEDKVTALKQGDQELNPDGMPPFDENEIMAARHVPDELSSLRSKAPNPEDFPDDDGPSDGA